MRAYPGASEVSQRLDDIPDVGPLIATALVASVPDLHAFKSGRDLAAWIGLVPRQNSTGGKERLGHISKAGNRYLRMLLVVGALSVIRRAKQTGYTRKPWLTELLQRRSIKVAAIARANKNARTVWAMMAHGTSDKEPESQAVRTPRFCVFASAALRLRVCDRDPICGEHYGQWPSKSAASTGRTHGSTDQLCITVKNPLPTGSRPHMAKSGGTRHRLATPEHRVAGGG